MKNKNIQILAGKQNATVAINGLPAPPTVRINVHFHGAWSSNRRVSGCTIAFYFVGCTVCSLVLKIEMPVTPLRLLKKVTKKLTWEVRLPFPLPSSFFGLVQRSRL